jgi:hypothetical protein
MDVKQRAERVRQLREQFEKPMDSWRGCLERSRALNRARAGS